MPTISSRSKLLMLRITCLLGAIWIPLLKSVIALDGAVAENKPIIEWGLPTGGVQCGIQLAKNSFYTGDAITITVFTKNHLDHPVYTANYKSPDLNYNFFVIQSPKTLLEINSPFRESDLNRGITTSRRKTLQPEEVLTDEFDLAVLYSMREPGEYLVYMVRRLVGNSEGKYADVISGTVKFAIASKGPADQTIGGASTATATASASGANGGKSTAVTLAGPQEAAAAKTSKPATKTASSARVDPFGHQSSGEKKTSPSETRSETLGHKPEGRENRGSRGTSQFLIAACLGVIGFILYRAAQRG